MAFLVMENFKIMEGLMKKKGGHGYGNQAKNLRILKEIAERWFH
jgi:hypothetical protein